MLRGAPSTAIEWRLKQLRAIKKLLLENKDEITKAVQADLRRPETECILAETFSAVGEVDHAIENLASWMEPESVPTPLAQKPGTSEIRRDPVGVVLVISPWNFPINLCINPLTLALAAGNTVVIKPSEVSCHSANFLGRVLPRYLPSDAVKIVQGGVPETTALLEQRFDHIIYTGGGTVARVVMAAAARHLTPVTLELGGKSPVIVDKSADIDVTARRILFGKFLNCGQVCIAPDYVLVHKDVESQLLAAMKRTIRSWYGKDPAAIKASKDLGRIINARHFARVAKMVESHRGDIVEGGQLDESELYVAPTILSNPALDDMIMRDEIFGPVLPVIRVNDTNEAIRFIGERPKPLALYVFAGDSSIQEKVLQNTTSGGVAVNDTILHIANPNLPFGGVGDSGMGAYHGKIGFDIFSHKKGVKSTSTWLDPSARYPPYTDSKLRLVSMIVLGMPKVPGGKAGILGILVLLGLVASRFTRGSKL